MDITQKILDFVIETNYEDLPGEVIHEAKRSFLDAVGCAIIGLATDKGKIAASVGCRLGGPQESTILGLGDRVSCTNAAMANAELINALDYDAIPHVHPFAIPPALAVAEATGASGRDLILAMVLAQEISRRFTLALSNMMATLTSESKMPDVWGNANECIFGGAVGAAKILGLGREKLAHTLGLAAYLCPLPACRDWEDAVPKSMVKYVPVGWVSQGAVTAAMLANDGFTGNPSVLDGEYGFWRFYGAQRWAPEVIIDGLGDRWRFMEMIYKTYPCCVFLHPQLDAFIKILEAHKLQPEDIDSVESYSLPFLANPAPYDVQTQVDVQFSVPFVFSAAAHRIRVGADWQDHSTIHDPNIRSFMRKVTMIVDPKAIEKKKENLRSSPARVVVKAKGRIYEEESYYTRGTNLTEFGVSDEDLITKFKSNASRLLTPEKTDRAIEMIMALDQVGNVMALAPLLGL
jgi:2-methylcitrate dehydratase PrpD